MLQPFFACCSKVLLCQVLLTKVLVLPTVCFSLRVRESVGRSSSYCWLSAPSPVPWHDPVTWKGWFLGRGGKHHWRKENTGSFPCL